MHIQRARQFRSIDCFPNTKIYTHFVSPNHPTQIHINSFCSRIIQRIRNMFLCSVLMGNFKKNRLKFGNTFLHGKIGLIFGKNSLQSFMVFVNMLQSQYKSFTIHAIKRAVHKFFKSFQIVISMRHHKVKRCIAHQFHQFFCIGNNHFSISPGNGCTQKSCNFNIFFQCKPMRNLNGVALNKVGSVIKFYLFVKKFFKF